MAEIIQGTTPSINIALENNHYVDDIVELLATVVQGNKIIKKGLDDVILDSEYNEICINLTESDTLSLSAGVANVQVRYKLECDDNIYASRKYPIRIYPLMVMGLFDEEVSGNEG